MMSLVKQHKNVYRMITKVNGFTQANAKAARTELEVGTQKLKYVQMVLTGVEHVAKQSRP